MQVFTSGNIRIVATTLLFICQSWVFDGSVYGQATCSTPTLISGFGVDGDVHANTPALIGGDSWFYNAIYPGAGIGVIGLTAATAQPAITAAQFNSLLQGASTSQGRNRTYVQRMGYPSLTVVNTFKLIDAFAARDNISPDTTAFTGSNKNGDNPTIWNIGISSVPNKNDIIDVGGHLRRFDISVRGSNDPPMIDTTVENNSSNVDDLWMFAFVTKLATGGDSYTDIEIYRTVPVLNLSTGKLTNTGPAATGGHTAFLFNNDGTLQSPGDIILCMNYGSSGGVASVRIWCNINNLDGNNNGYTWFNTQANRPFNFSGDFIIGSGTNGYGYAEITSLSGAPCLVFSVLNSANAMAGAWGNLTGSSASYDTNIEPDQLVNIAFNFTEMGLDFSTLAGPCANVFGALFYKTRSSSSYSSELKDCSGPFVFGNFSEIQANAGPDKSLNCTTSQVTLDGSSATPGANISWTTSNGNIVSGSTTTTPVVNVPGTYIMTAQNPSLSSCIATDTVVVSLDLTAPIANAGTDRALTCSEPSLSLSGSSPVSGATFSWTAINGGNIVTGANTATPVVNAAGCYVLTVTNPANGCTGSDTMCVTMNIGAATITATSTVNVACYGGCDGALTISASGGQAPYTYLWSNGSTATSITGLCAGGYTVTVTGSNGCTSTQSYQISQPNPGLSSTAVSTQSVSCTGGANGAAAVNASGGTLPYTYLWNNSTTTSSIAGLTAGTYTVTVTDGNGCTSQSSVTITQPASSIALTISASQNISCYGGNNGSIDVTPSGGTPSYTYLWSNGSTTQDLSNVTSGSYTVTVTDANGCSASQTVTLSQPSAALALSLTMTQPVACFGGSSGSASSTVSGGTSPYTYLWSTGATTSAINSLTAGIYTLTVTDINGCTASQTVSITQPSAALSSSIAAMQPVSCFGGSNGSVNLTVAGGTSPYSYQWNNGATTQDLSNVIAGTFTVTVTDTRGCTTVNSVTVTQPSGALNASAVASASVSCFGGNNGAITLTVSGGTAAYSYQWSTGATTQNISGLTSGTYIVTVTDANNCVTTTSVQVTQPAAALAASISVSQNVSCFGGNNGSISLTVTNGTAPYTYQWSNGATTQNITSLATGTYTVTITDANGCTLNRNATVNQPAAALNPSVTATGSVSCFGGNDGSVNLSVSGGTSPYTYLWNNGVTTQDLSNVASGTYNVTITDANGCTATAATTVTQPAAALSASIAASQQVSCFSGNNGAITLTVSGGTTLYSYNWSNGATTQNISGLSVGTYSVTVTDARGCVATASQTITQPSAALSTTASVTQQVSCFGDNNGSINLSVAGGTTPYSYNWSNGSVTEDISGLAAGSYSVTVTDVNGCTAQRTVTINQPLAALSSSATLSQAVSCFGGGDGQITLNTTGGTSPYTYLWSNGATSAAINGLSVGTYTVSVTDANGCTTATSATVTQPAASLGGSTAVTANISCFSGNNGAIDLTVTGGTAPYTYMWSTGATTQDLTGLPAGSFTVTITDANGCTFQTGDVITQPVGALAANLTVSQNVNCFGGGNGALDLTVSGGTTPYTYLWSNGATTEDISGLAVGIYTVSISDVNGCISSATGSITQPSAALNATVTSSTQVSCFAGNDGAINLTVTGGTIPYAYQWNNGATSQDINNLPTGNYTVTVTDANGCTFIQSTTVTQPAAALNATLSASMDVLCYGGANGSITLNVSGGTTPYTYAWSNGATSQNISGLSGDTYTVLVTDINGCNTTLAVTINEPAAAVQLNIQSSQAILCYAGNNGEILLNTTGGTAPYTYQWNNGATTSTISGLTTGTFTATVTDANGCTETVSATLSQPLSPLASSIVSTVNVFCFAGNDGSIDLDVSGGTAPYTYTWNNGATTQDLNNLAAGIYTVLITDANGCTETQTVQIDQPTATLNAGATVTANVLCNAGYNGSIDLTVTGGTTPYSFSWNTGDTSEDLSNLTAGTYTVTITDMNGCTATASATVTEPVAALSSVIASSQNVNCFGGNNGSITLQVSGGTTPYTFLWSNGETTQDISGLVTGTYTVSITDANGCTTGNALTITQPQAVLSAIIYGTINVSCNGGNNGSIDVTITGGTLPYTFVWNNGEITEDISNLAAGTYSVTVTDANGCTTDLSTTITEPVASLSITVTSAIQIDCFGGENGSIDLTISGGTAPYTYAWNTGETMEDLINLGAGTFSVLVSDANGCFDTLSVTLTQPAAPLLAGANVNSNVNCFGGNNGNIDLTVNGGTTPYSFLWSTGETTEDISNLATGNYTVTVTDANGCTTSVQATVSQPAQSLSASATTQDVLCFNGNNGMIDLTVIGGTPPYAYNWSNGATSEDVGALVAGIYIVTITDANGCDTTLSATIIEPSAPLIPIITIDQHVSCHGGNDGAISAVAGGGTPPYVYLWSNGATTTSVTGLPAGQYVLTVTDANGCNAIISDFINEPAASLFTPVTVAQNVSCFGGNNGSIVTNATGGTSPYTYLWNTGAVTPDLQNLTEGTYTITVTDSQGCTFTGSATVTQPAAPLSMTGTTTIANCLYGIGGDVTIQVNGGTTPYNYLWSNGSTTQNLTNMMPASYTVTVTDANGCTLTETFIVNNQSLAVLEHGDTIICVGEFTTLWVDTIPGATYQWYFSGQPLNGATAPSFTTPAAGYYYVSVTTVCGTFNTDSVEVQVKTVENATISNTQIVCPPEIVQLHATGGITYEWSPNIFISATNNPDPHVGPAYTTTYTVHITNEYGCEAELSVEIGVACDTLFVPNGFSPNSDGTNDGYVIDHIDKYPGNRLWVYNRWGNLVYKARDYKNDWDGIANVSGLYLGKKVPAGTYFFILDLNDGSKPMSGYLIIRY